MSILGSILSTIFGHASRSASGARFIATGCAGSASARRAQARSGARRPACRLQASDARRCRGHSQQTGGAG